MGLYSGGRIIGRIFASEIWGAYFREGGGGGAYYRNFTASRYKPDLILLSPLVFFQNFLAKYHCMGTAWSKQGLFKGITCVSSTLIS